MNQMMKRVFLKPLLHGQILSNAIFRILSFFRFVESKAPFYTVRFYRIIISFNNIKQLHCCVTNTEDQVASAAILIVLVLKDEEIRAENVQN